MCGCSYPLHLYPARVCAGGVKRLFLSVRLSVHLCVCASVCPWQNSAVGISEGLNNFYTWQEHIVSVDFSMCVLDKLNSPVCRRTWLESLWYRRHFLPCVASYPGFCLQDCYMCNNDSWLARGMCAPHTSSCACGRSCACAWVLSWTVQLQTAVLDSDQFQTLTCVMHAYTHEP